MAGTAENAGVWLPPASPSPRTFFSSVLAQTMEAPNPSLQAQPPPDVKNEEPLSTSDANSYDIKDEKRKPTSVFGDQRGNDGLSSETRAASAEQKWSSTRGSLGERVAARAGFNAPRLNTEGIRGGSDPSQMSGLRSPYLTIPPGLSPTSLLESPVFVSNSMVQPSPTTGKYQFLMNGDFNSSMLGSAASQTNSDGLVEDGSASFTFKPVLESRPSVFTGDMNSHSFLPTEGQVQANVTVDRVGTCKVNDQSPNPPHLQVDFSGSSVEKDADANRSDQRASDLVPLTVDDSQFVEGDQRGVGDETNGGTGGCNSSGAASEDGYNWRKYGQKQVKGSEFPRSYYKCTHQNCPVKKKVERSHEGHITEIIYKGAHNHPKPPQNRRSAIGSSNQLNEMNVDISENVATQIRRPDGDPAWLTTHKALEWRNDTIEVTSSASGGPEYCPQSTPLNAQDATHSEVGDVVDVSSTFSNNEEEDDRGTHGSVSLGQDEGDESESKRRKIEAYVAELGGATRAIREPRVVVQTTSEVDILDDGYRWRKYGQKVVKGNPNPRSYYKCTSPGCNVRKHVERASHDLKSVITTYEGKHNHDVPAARNSSHINSGASNATAQASAFQSHVRRPEPSQVNNNINMPRFDGSPSFGSFGVSASSHLVSSRSFSFGMNQPPLTNLAMNGFGSTQQRLPVFTNPYMGQQPQQQMNQVGYTLPRGDLKTEPATEPVVNLPGGPSVYNQFMGRLPVEHQR